MRPFTHYTRIAARSVQSVKGSRFDSSPLPILAPLPSFCSLLLECSEIGTWSLWCEYPENYKTCAYRYGALQGSEREREPHTHTHRERRAREKIGGEREKGGEWASRREGMAQMASSVVSPEKSLPIIDTARCASKTCHQSSPLNLPSEHAST